MFFILSKTIHYLTMPFVLICLLFLLSVLIRNTRWKKRFFWLGFGFLFFFSNEFILNEVLRRWEIKPTPLTEIRQSYEWAIVLTGVTQFAEDKPDDRVYFQKGADRVTHTVQLYKLGLVKNILISGGSGRLIEVGHVEAEEIRQAMLMMGVPDSVMIVEPDSKNTHESAVAVAKILKERTIEPSQTVLITSAFHLRRSLACFKKEGIPMQGFSVDFYSHPTYFTPDVLLIPDVYAIFKWHRMIREWVGIAAYWSVGYI
jgi:uncharacterized SAM-binding protein YcdF (DUF218 family)